MNKPPAANLHLARQSNWQDYALSLYNPLSETQYLKAAKDKTAAFLTLRQAHIYRHDFICYDSNLLDLTLSAGVQKSINNHCQVGVVTSLPAGLKATWVAL